MQLSEKGEGLVKNVVDYHT